MGAVGSGAPSLSPITELPASFRAAPTTMLIWGAPRVLVNLVGGTIAQEIDRQFVALTIRDPAEPPTEYEKAEWKRADMKRVLVTNRPADLAPNVAARRMDLWKVVAGDDPDSSGTLLSDFLTLPTKVQEMWETHELGHGPRVFLAANADRFASYYPVHSQLVPALIDVFRRQGITLVATYSGPERADRFVWDHVLRVDGSRPIEEGLEGEVLVEKGAATGPLGTGRRVPLTDLTFLTAADARTRAMRANA